MLAGKFTFEFDTLSAESMSIFRPIIKLVNPNSPIQSAHLSHVFFVWIRVKGKLIRRSLKTETLSTAKLRLADLDMCPCDLNCYPVYQPGNLSALPDSETDDSSKGIAVIERNKFSAALGLRFGGVEEKLYVHICKHKTHHRICCSNSGRG